MINATAETIGQDQQDRQEVLLPFHASSDP